MRSSSPGILFLGILAVLFGLVGAYGVKKHLETNEVQPAAAPPAEPMLTVPLAIRDLAEGRKITNGDFTTVALTESQAADMQLPVGVMTTVENGPRSASVTRNQSPTDHPSVSSAERTVTRA